jgi:gamma-glutamyltranspeptidase
MRFGGNVSWSDLIQPTIDLIVEGIPTSNALASALHDKRDAILQVRVFKVANYFKRLLTYLIVSELF